VAAHRIAIIVPRSFTLFGLAAAVEAFAYPRPELDLDWYEVRICSAEPGPAQALDGLFTAHIEHGMEAVDQAQTVVAPQADTLDHPADQVVLDAVRRAHERGARLVSFCTGAFVLAAAGVLDGREAATHWKFAARLARDYPRVRVNDQVLYIDDGQILTSAGTAAAVDLSLHILRKDHGARVARHIARSMVVPPHRDGGQAQFVMSPIPEAAMSQDGVHRALQHASAHLDQTLGLSEMAALAFMSTRNFSRRFREVTGTTPSKWLLSQRLTRVRELLEETDEPIERIAQLTGFGSAVTLRQRFAQTLRTSPTAYRKAFRATADRAAS
jgi:AraC family transcriptional activator FtrA